jgi:hypothetical protein
MVPRSGQPPFCRGSTTCPGTFPVRTFGSERRFANFAPNPFWFTHPGLNQKEVQRRCFGARPFQLRISRRVAEGLLVQKSHLNQKEAWYLGFGAKPVETNAAFDATFGYESSEVTGIAPPVLHRSRIPGGGARSQVFRARRALRSRFLDEGRLDLRHGDPGEDVFL